MKIVTILSDLEGKETPATFDVADAMPEGSVVIGKVPEVLRPIMIEAIRLTKEASEIKRSSAVTALENFVTEMRNSTMGTEITLPAPNQETIKEAKALTDLAVILSQIFWYETKEALAVSPQPGDLAISRDWDVFITQDQDCDECGALHLGAVFAGMQGFRMRL